MGMITRATTVYTEEGFCTLGDLRQLVELTVELDESTPVSAGMKGRSEEQFDTLVVEGLVE